MNRQQFTTSSQSLAVTGHFSSIQHRLRVEVHVFSLLMTHLPREALLRAVPGGLLRGGVRIWGVNETLGFVRSGPRTCIHPPSHRLQCGTHRSWSPPPPPSKCHNNDSGHGKSPPMPSYTGDGTSPNSAIIQNAAQCRTGSQALFASRVCNSCCPYITQIKCCDGQQVSLQYPLCRSPQSKYEHACML